MLIDNETVTTTFAPLETIDVGVNCSLDVHVSDVNSSLSDKLVGPEVKTMRATEIAGRAADLVGGDRDRQHGQKEDNFRRIATMWNAWLQTRKDPAETLGAHDVGIMMVLMKLARTQSGNLNIDDYIDACGYAACAGEVAQAE